MRWRISDGMANRDRPRSITSTPACSSRVDNSGAPATSMICCTNWSLSPPPRSRDATASAHQRPVVRRRPTAHHPLTVSSISRTNASSRRRLTK